MHQAIHYTHTLKLYVQRLFVYTAHEMSRIALLYADDNPTLKMYFLNDAYFTGAPTEVNILCANNSSELFGKSYNLKALFTEALDQGFKGGLLGPLSGCTPGLCLNMALQVNVIFLFTLVKCTNAANVEH